uniref:histidine kinase dimerization/phosphoacceptor domain -containing protein n=1 Tax=Pararhizobium sp. IMCC3301 TaxID=3067904 RepID=UPI0027419010|nr:histidine kinase dimerization/phosphoacceptor domain -containing protein [Pararhizobium sp. IMCC3301]
MVPVKHPDEQLRLNSLRSYNILDTAADTDFTEIVELAAAICETPVSLISFVDSDRQWFKARVGFPESETGLDRSVCAHALLEGDYLEINDMGSDPRTSDNPLHTGDVGVNFYAGAVLVAPDGMPLGTLCVLDTKPRELTPVQKQALMVLSKQVVKQLELRKRLQIEVSLRQEIDHRVKNSLQTIASILRVSTRQVTDEAAIEILQLVERRLNSVAALHVELMGKDENSGVDAGHYLRRVQDLLQQVMPDNISMSIDYVDCALEQSKASAIGMIVSEFVANSVKHAFPDGASGEIQIALTQTSNDHLLLTCRDNGTGRALPSQTPDLSSGLGKQIMSSAAIQLGGNLQEDFHASGTALTVEFKNRR